MQLSTSDLKETLELINACLIAKSTEDLIGIFKTLLSSFNLNGALYVNQAAFDLNSFETATISSVGLANEWGQIYKDRKFSKIDPILTSAYDAEVPVIWSEAYNHSNINADFQNLASDFGLNEGISFGTSKSNYSGSATLVSLIYGSTAIPCRDKEMLFNIIPHLNEVLKKPSISCQFKLTIKELEVLSWAKDGKSYWETGQIIGSSERTVKYHLQNIYKKFGVSNRSQAIAVAMRSGLLEL